VTPRRAVVVLLDSLNRHLLGAYGGREFATPNLDRFAARAVRFERHYAGSLPCIPARHDLLCGALDFLWKPWGSIEIWEQSVTAALHAAGVTSVLVTDHPHLFETGGENYHTDFTAWNYERGHESDPWKTRPDASWIGAPSFQRGWTPYDNSRGYFRGEEDFPGPRTMATAARWLAEHGRFHDRFLLFIDEFDPHEPFDTPEPYASMYDPTWEGPHLIWPPYVEGAIKHGILSDREAVQIRACYGAKLTMIDHWFGQLIETLDRDELWETTAVIVCTDHGHYLGEKDIWGKPGVPIYEPLGHIPLLIAWPGVAPRPVTALTTAVDIHATLLDIFAVSVPHRTHGRSLVPLLEGTASTIRDYALSGIWGREVHLLEATNDHRAVVKYARGSAGSNAPLSMWSNRWSTMPIPQMPQLRLPLPDDRAFLDHMPGSTVPVMRQPFREGDLLPYWAFGSCTGHHLFDLHNDPREEENLIGTALESRLADRLRDVLQEIEAPDDQFIRLGLT